MVRGRRNKCLPIPFQRETVQEKGTPLLACLNARENTPTKLANQRERRRRRCECEPKAALTLPAPLSIALSVSLFVSLSLIMTLLKCDPLAKCRFVIGAFSVDKTNDDARRATFFSCLARSPRVNTYNKI